MQTVLADAVGPTTVQVDRALLTLRRRYIAKLNSEASRIADIAELVCIAGLDDNCLHLAARAY